ncbi:MAG: N-acyl homoserine lactonase family protein [Prolixibacteraceae bacterium]|jgi:glyoxylase-like metal-dependent hydrolase (beta-lactamase superfamily II)|nr:N-acyl homoserine lactonase family protein [Prolixibacteraceae bacterium]
MKLYILNTGYLETDMNNVEACANIGTKSQPHVLNKWIKLPVICFLIENEGEYVLYDTGSHPDAMNGYWPDNLQEIYPLYQKEEEKLENQLALCGVKPEQIKTVILSHMHLDHAGNLHLFKHADIYVPKADFMHARTQIQLNPSPITHGGYIKNDLEVVAKQYHLVDEDFQLSEGIDVINLPGHTPGLLGVVVHLKDQGSFILPQDAVYTENIYGPPAKASGLLYDSLSYFKSIEKVRKLQQQYNAKVIFAHDDSFFQTLVKAPKYYE